MDQQKMQVVVKALERYFEQARPDDDAFNAMISRKDREQYGGEMLLLGPAVIIDNLREVVRSQMVYALYNEKAADRDLQLMGLRLLMCYRSLAKAQGMGGVTVLTTVGLTLADEDAIALMAYALASLTEDSSLVRMALGSAVPVLRDEFNKRHGTGCKVALAYALLRLGSGEPFKSFAIPHLVPGEQQRSLEHMLASKGDKEQRFIEWLVLGSLIMDIASEGCAMPHWKRGT